MKKMCIYYDMDNTLCKWSDRGQDEKALKDMYKKGYYRNLPIIDDSDKVLKKLNDLKNRLNIELYIISACIDSIYCKQEKIEYLKEYFNFIDDDNIILIDNGKNKSQYIKSKNDINILVDDYKKNLQEWEQAGGIAIKKRYSNKKGYDYIIHNHSDIFDILDKIRLEK